MEDNTLQLDCVIRGAHRQLDFDDAVRAYWQANYAWAIPIDLYNWRIDGYAGSASVPKLVKPTPRRFGLYLHTRGTHALTIDTMSELEGRRIESKTFQGYAARFNKLFGDMPNELRPFFCYGIDNFGQHAVLGYRMRSDRTWCVVNGVTVGQGVENDDVDWTPFQQPQVPDEVM